MTRRAGSFMTRRRKRWLPETATRRRCRRRLQTTRRIGAPIHIHLRLADPGRNESAAQADDRAAVRGYRPRRTAGRRVDWSCGVRARIQSLPSVPVTCSTCPSRMRSKPWWARAFPSETARPLHAWRERLPVFSASRSQPTSIRARSTAGAKEPRASGTRPSGSRPAMAATSYGSLLDELEKLAHRKDWTRDGGGLPRSRSADSRSSRTPEPERTDRRPPALQRLPGTHSRTPPTRTADRRDRSTRHRQDPTRRERGRERVARRRDGARRVNETTAPWTWPWSGQTTSAPECSFAPGGGRSAKHWRVGPRKPSPQRPRTRRRDDGLDGVAREARARAALAKAAERRARLYADLSEAASLTASSSRT